ncbi:MAG: hypothetical protein R2697_10305 [Ilumatobacteraceae bacterium]
MKQWLRNAPAMKPMYTDAERRSSRPTVCLRRHAVPRPSEDQIDKLVAYPLERKREELRWR